MAVSSVLYFAESPEHAVAEQLQGYRGRLLREHHLRRSGNPLALSSAHPPASVQRAITDLCDPDELARRRVRPDTLASRDFSRTRQVAEALYSDGRTGLRWWSSFSGDWHTIVLFCGRLGATDLVFGEPEALSLGHPAVAMAAGALGIGPAGKRRLTRR